MPRSGRSASFTSTICCGSASGRLGNGLDHEPHVVDALHPHPLAFRLIGAFDLPKRAVDREPPSSIGNGLLEHEGASDEGLHAAVEIGPVAVDEFALP